MSSISEHTWKLVNLVIKEKIHTYAFMEAVKLGNGDKYSHILKVVNALLGGCGIEYFKDKDDNYISYVNMGDTYIETVIFDEKKYKFYITSYGDFIENNPRRFPD